MKVRSAQRIHRIIMSLGFLFIPARLAPATVIFDLNGVLIKTSKFKASSFIGYSLFIPYFLSFNTTEQLNERLFDFFDALAPRAPYTPAACHGDRLLPQIMCDWLCGRTTAQQLHNLVQQELEKDSYQFSSRLEKKLICSITSFLFNPAQLAQTYEPSTGGVEIARLCRTQCDRHNQPKHRLIILSNFDTETFKLLRDTPRFAELFSLFDDIIISGYEHLIKPDIRIFLNLFCKYDINPDYDLCVFIDDQPENVAAFNSCGEKTKGIVCTNLNYKHVKHELQTLGII